MQENKVAYYCRNYIKSLVITYKEILILKTCQNITWLNGLKQKLKLVSMTSLVFYFESSLLAKYLDWT